MRPTTARKLDEAVFDATPERLQEALDELKEQGILPPYKLTLPQADWARDDVRRWAGRNDVQVTVTRADGRKPKRVR